MAGEQARLAPITGEAEAAADAAAVRKSSDAHADDAACAGEHTKVEDDDEESQHQPEKAEALLELWRNRCRYSSDNVE